ncbi:outer membrane protein assembly factor BamE [Comamonas sp. NoAH]|uniref:outer membrane protein assembly factor BamE domain-containing protein n=1 Tax=Comamonas halotolerans TaxID=3041496 RepID=UPI0024E04CC5|nr:outer membrane protein assembly factor BamE [Comamonas sp. NoAH]
MNLLNRATATVAAIATSILALVGCDQQKINGLEEGLSTEIDVRKAFGEPETIWPEADGSRTFEYPRQPMGHRNYMITIGSDGVMTALRQVLTPHVFEQIQPGMTQEQVRRILGKPAKRVTYNLKQETDWDWNWIDPPNREMEFTVTFGENGTVKKTASREKMPQGDR